MIDYGAIDRACTFYDRLGFDRIETPWLVSRAISDITKPEGASSYSVTKETRQHEKVFVASGEQSLLYLIAKNQLPRSGKFQTVTPCMRDEPFDETHVKYFMKLELITYWPRNHQPEPGFDMKVVLDTLGCARSFFQSELRFQGYSPDRITSAKTGETTYDLFLDEVEIGSYGVRQCDACTWVYGTGIAEPRFSKIAKTGIKNGLPPEKNRERPTW